MPSSPPSEEQPLTPPSPSPADIKSPAQPTPAEPPDSSAKPSSGLISLCGGALFVSFFLPWVTFLGTKINGLDIGKNFSSYQLVWVMPILAALIFVLSVSRNDSWLIRVVAGLYPFAILVYAMDSLGVDLVGKLEFGAWLALVSGIALVFVPSGRKPTTPA